MYSASICKEDFLGIKKKVRYEDEKLTERLEIVPGGFWQ